MKKLLEWHKTAAALLAQGIDRRDIAAICDCTPEYLTMLQGQPLFMAHVREMTAAAQTQLESLYVKSVEVIRETLDNGSEDGKLKAVKLQGELSGRIGRGVDQRPAEQGERLEVLADRLVALLNRKRERIVDGQVVEAQIVPG